MSKWLKIVKVKSIWNSKQMLERSWKKQQHFVFFLLNLTFILFRTLCLNVDCKLCQRSHLILSLFCIILNSHKNNFEQFSEESYFKHSSLSALNNRLQRKQFSLVFEHWQIFTIWFYQKKSLKWLTSLAASFFLLRKSLR